MKIMNFLLVLVALLIIFNPSTALAATDYSFTKSDQKQIINGSAWYDPIVSCTNPEQSAKSQEIGNVYFVGDSILEGSKDTIKNLLVSQGVEEGKISFNSEVSRSINKSNPKIKDSLSGIEAIKKDKDTIQKANTVVVELGTNGGIGKDDVKKVVKEIKDINDKASIFWINIGVTRSDLLGPQKDSNKVLDDTHKDEGFTIIDWDQEVKNAIKQSINPLIDGVHPNIIGSGFLAEIIMKETRDSVTQPLGTLRLTTNFDNSTYKGRVAKVWAYLTSPEGLGLTPVQAAGAMGNMQQENSQFDPKVRQSSPPSPHIIVDGSHGYGIIQWTSSGRQQGLENHANSVGKSSGSLDAQLSYIKHELNNGYKNTLVELKKVKDDPVEAAFVWHGAGNFSINSHLTPSPGFEGSGDSESTVRNVRGGNAKKWLTQLGDKVLPYIEVSKDNCKPIIDDSDLGVTGSTKYTDSPQSIPKGQEVADQAKKWAKNDPNCGFHGGKCLNQCLGIVSDLWTSQGKSTVTGYDAWEAYNRYKNHGWVNKTKEIPVGAIMWSAKAGNPGNGHAYTYVGNGLIASNDIKTPGKYSIASADDIEKKWGHTFLGWSQWHG